MNNIWSPLSLFSHRTKIYISGGKGKLEQRNCIAIANNALRKPYDLKRIYSLCYLQNHLENMLLNSNQLATFLSNFCADTAKSYTFKTNITIKPF